MIELIHDKINSDKNITFTFIFDGTFSSEKELNYAYYKSFNLIFTPKDMTADSYIKKELIHKNSKPLTVVSSDKGITNTCKELGVNIQSSQKFLKWALSKGSKDKETKPKAETKSDFDRLLNAFTKKFNDQS